MNIKEIFYPDLPKIIIFIALGILLWFFPIFSKSLFAIPFFNIEINYFSIFNFILAYMFSSLIVSYQNKKLVVVGLIFLFVVLFFVTPKVVSFGIGDLGWSQRNYCTCYGVLSEVSSCCHSVVEYCMGICLRNETSYSHGY
jgi:hypothetical protein